MGLVVLLTGCARRPCPNWFVNPPQDPNYLYVPAIAMAKDPKLATMKATAIGRNDLASQIDIHIEGLRRRVQEKTGESEDSQLILHFIQVTRQMSSPLRSIVIMEESTKKEDGIYRACVLMAMPLGAFKEELLARLMADLFLERYSRLWEELLGPPDWPPEPADPFPR